MSEKAATIPLHTFVSEFRLGMACIDGADLGRGISVIEVGRMAHNKLTIMIRGFLSESAVLLTRFELRKMKEQWKDGNLRCGLRHMGRSSMRTQSTHGTTFTQA